MLDIIQLLPDSIANQIAAGEVIQRPASVVKELVENAIDAGSTEIKIIIKNAGKTLIQVIDNGKGMSDTDARMCFERHATSKIRKADDLFTITSKGFRGEALASIAAIAQVELITKKQDEELGRQLIISGSKVTKQQPCQAQSGTMFSVKNLFFNIPARRKFLKSDAVELKHILEEFKRIALAHPEVAISIYHNDQEVYILSKGNARQRIVAIFGKPINEKLVPVGEDTEIMKLSGFVGRPEAAKKSKGEQYLFVNDRFIKSNYLNHAVKAAYEDLIVKESYPLYILYIEVEPSQIDINVHPTKTEIKFEEERLIYNYIRVAIKHGLAHYNVSPTLDFGTNSNFGNNILAKKEYGDINREYNHGTQPNHMGGRGSRSQFEKSNLKAWENIYQGLENHAVSNETDSQASIIVPSKISSEEGKKVTKIEEGRHPYQIHNTYILSHIKSGFLLIDQQAAHERILYERNLASLSSHQRLTQKELFPRSIELDNAKATIMQNILPKINALGFEIEEFGNKTFLIHGIPAGLVGTGDATVLMEKLIDQYVSNMEFQLGLEENLARSLAVSAAIKRGKVLEVPEMKLLIDQLFACEVPYKSPTGRRCIVTMDMDTIIKKFVN
ncbi:MAG: DNA mismatch repair endonuclease MutL [Saprospiraceae bacterium]